MRDDIDDAIREDEQYSIAARRAQNQIAQAEQDRIADMERRLRACWALLDIWERTEYMPIDPVRRMLRAALEGNDGH